MNIIKYLKHTIISLLFFYAQSAYAFDTTAKQLLIVDYDTDQILLEKNPDESMYPASMTKMMTVYILFERLKEGVISLDDRFSISEKAWKMGGSKMFLEAGKRVIVEDLLRGIIVQSGNDATIVVAEAIAGSEENFAEIMNSKAAELGMTQTNFVNASGWPNENHYTTARDLAILIKATIKNFPEYYKIYKEKTFTYSNIKQNNRNPLLYGDLDADGLKTGHTEASGYGLAASAVIGDGNAKRRVIMVINGLESKKQRANESERLIGWALREWKNYQLFNKNETVLHGDVWLGDQNTVKMITDQDITILAPYTKRRKMRVRVKYNNPIAAPIKRQDKIGELLIDFGNDDSLLTYPLYAHDNIDELSFFKRIGAAFKYLLFGHSSS